MRYLDKLDQVLANRPYRNFINANAVWTNKKTTSDEFSQVWNAPYAKQNLGTPNNIHSVALQSSGLDAINAALSK